MTFTELVQVILIGITFTTVHGCSPPEGGFVEPTPAEIVHYASHVAVGEVTDILNPDPLYSDMFGSTYGAMVTVQCTYKGTPLPGRITIGGAGFIPGHCEAQPLDKGVKYVLFLQEKREAENIYEQSHPAVNKSSLGDYLGVCNLDLQYPEEKGMVLKRKECPPPSQLDSCQRYTVDSSVVQPVSVDAQPKQQSESTKQQAADSTKGTGNDGGGAAQITTSLAAILVSFALLLLY